MPTNILPTANSNLSHCHSPQRTLPSHLPNLLRDPTPSLCKFWLQKSEETQASVLLFLSTMSESDVQAELRTTKRDSTLGCTTYFRTTEFHTHPCHFPCKKSVSCKTLSNLLFSKPQPPQLKMGCCRYQTKQEMRFPFKKKEKYTSYLYTVLHF